MVNLQAERLFGYTAQEAIGQHIRLIAGPEYHREQLEFLTRVGRGETVGPLDTKRRRKDGKTVESATAGGSIIATADSFAAAYRREQRIYLSMAGRNTSSGKGRNRFWRAASACPPLRPLSRPNRVAVTPALDVRPEENHPGAKLFL
ncbi:MAG: PAS domain S-box protein [Akkermansiaceae bacterium]|nr:PAS domain S-box protein [Akkermansiaceae bacterium]